MGVRQGVPPTNMKFLIEIETKTHFQEEKAEEKLMRVLELYTKHIKEKIERVKIKVTKI